VWSSGLFMAGSFAVSSRTDSGIVDTRGGSGGAESVLKIGNPAQYHHRPC
jgi:hypothetical protein